MEKQKIFWVVLSVSIFVVIVLVVGVLLLKQRPSTAVATAPGTVNPISDSGTQIYEYQREAPGKPQGTAPTPGQKPDDTETMHFYIGEPSPTPPQGTQPPAAVPLPPPPLPAPEPAVSPQVPQKPPAAAQVARGPTAPAVKAAPQKRSPQARTPQARTPQKTYDYWIQTGSYKSQDKAEELAGMLGAKGLAGRVFSSTLRNETYFRVRIGPYSNKGEAEKFLAIVKQVQGLESSYISMVGASKAGLN
jgi:cell division protein FtsN